MSRVAAVESVSRAPRPVRLRVRADAMIVQHGGLFDDEVSEERVPVLELSGGDEDARRLLESFGAVELACLEHYVPEHGSTADYAVCVDGSVHDYCSFSAYALPQLRALGWDVEVADDYPYRLLDGDVPWYAQIEHEGAARPDWFSLELGVAVGGRRVSLLPALLDLLERSPDHGSLASVMRVASRCVALPVGQGVFLPVPAEQLRRILSVLRELYEGERVQLDRLGGSGRGRRGRGSGRATLSLSRLQAAVLPALEDAFEDDPARLRWQGGAELRDLGRALIEARPRARLDGSGLRAELRGYQRDGVDWLQHMRTLGFGAVLADDMGLGKTLQTIAHLLCEKQAGRLFDPALVVAPTSLVPGWQREISRFAPQLSVLAWQGSRRRQLAGRFDAVDVLLTSYPLLWRDLERFRARRFHVVVLDEAQAIKNHRSRASKAARTLETDQRIALTGTPMENNLGELHALFDFAVPGLLGSREHFRGAYEVPVELGDCERLDDLRRRVAPFTLRRMKTEVAAELPPKTEIVRPVALDDDQRELYESIRIAAHADVRKAIRSKGLAASTIPVLDALMKLRQVCCHPRLVAVPAAQKVRSSAKLDLFLDLVSRQVAAGRRILVFSQFARMLAILSESLLGQGIGHLTLTGATRDRQEKIDAFQHGTAAVFLISLKAGGTGLNLTRADTVIHYDPWWNPAAQAQATDRAYRIGQTKPVFVYQLIVAGSVEERMLGLQQRKRQLADAILEGPGTTTTLRLEDVEDLFAPLED